MDKEKLKRMGLFLLGFGWVFFLVGIGPLVVGTAALAWCSPLIASLAIIGLIAIILGFILIIISRKE